MTLHPLANVIAELFSRLPSAEPDDLYLTVSGTEIYVALHEWAARKNPTLVRECKRYFGPLITDGEPPSVQLRGFQQIGDYTVKFHQYGAYSCEIVGYKPEPIDEEKQANEQLRAVAKIVANALAVYHVPMKPVWECKPGGAR